MNYSDINITGTGHIRTTCPNCSGNRKKSKEKCLSVDTDEKVYFCHHCGISGGGGNEKYFKTVKYEAPKSGLPENVIKWFESRKIPEHILEKNKIGYGKSFSDANGIQFPYYKHGRVVNIKHRTSSKKFRQEKDAEKCFYRYDVIKDNKEIIITEGEIDALSIQTMGMSNVISIPDGAPSAEAKTYRTKFNFLNDKLLEKVEKFILCMDNDEPGKVAEKELARRLGRSRCKTVTYPDGCKDANECLVKFGAVELQNVINKAVPYPIEGVLSTIDLETQVFEEYRNGIKGGDSTGWFELDPFFTIRQGEMTIITGIPSHGKSNYLDALAMNLFLSQGWRTAFFSPENWPVQRHVRTLAEKYVGCNFAYEVKHVQKMTEKQLKDALIDLKDVFKFIAPREKFMSVDYILEKADELITQFGIDGLVIDPWNEVDHNFKGLREDQYLSQKLTQIRRFAKTKGIHIFIAAHPRTLKKNEKTGLYDPPTTYDLSGGSMWYNKADNVICVHRHDFDSIETTIFVDKVRFKEIGKVGKCTLNYDTASGNYY